MTGKTQTPLEVWIAFGSNIENPIAQLAQARASIPSEALIETGASRLYRTAPWGYAAQADFYNAVVRYRCALSPQDLLARLQVIEQQQGRLRPFKNAPRTLDLDILLYGHKNIATTDLTIPHPAMTERLFVLAPLADLNPNLIVQGKSIADFLRVLPWQGIEVVEHPSWKPYLPQT